MKGRAAKPSNEDKLRLEGVAGEIIANTAKELAAKSPIRTREEDVTDKAAKLVNLCIERYIARRNIAFVPTTQFEATETIYKMIREELRTWPQDDLLIEASFILALTVVNQLRPHLI